MIRKKKNDVYCLKSIRALAKKQGVQGVQGATEPVAWIPADGVDDE